ncbi:MAG TPA: ROK family protein [Acidimicrobiia bacterium]|jgi:polyphosphate glucokinase
MSLGFGVDVGGSGIKGAPVDMEMGGLSADRYRIDTPVPAVPEAVAEVVCEIVDHFGWDRAFGVTVPAIVQHGVVWSAANIDPSWIGTDAGELLRKVTGRDVAVLNDADAAGIAEMTFGAGRGRRGVVVVLTFGTGIGSAIFNEGVLVPNTELGHIELHGGPAEHYAAGRLIDRKEPDLTPWARRVAEYLQYVERIFSPDLIIFGGGISKRFEEIAPLLDVRAPVVPAQLRNNAGIVGAAMAVSIEEARRR